MAWKRSCPTQSLHWSARESSKKKVHICNTQLVASNSGIATQQTFSLHLSAFLPQGAVLQRYIGTPVVQQAKPIPLAQRPKDPCRDQSSKPAAAMAPTRLATTRFPHGCVVSMQHVLRAGLTPPSEPVQLFPLPSSQAHSSTCANKKLPLPGLMMGPGSSPNPVHLTWGYDERERRSAKTLVHIISSCWCVNCEPLQTEFEEAKPRPGAP